MQFTVQIACTVVLSAGADFPTRRLKPEVWKQVGPKGDRGWAVRSLGLKDQETPGRSISPTARWGTWWVQVVCIPDKGCRFSREDGDLPRGRRGQEEEIGEISANGEIRVGA